MKNLYYALIILLLGLNVYIFGYRFDFKPEKTITGSIMDIQNVDDNTYILSKDKSDYYFYKVSKDKVENKKLNINDNSKLFVINNKIRIVSIIDNEIIMLDEDGMKIISEVSKETETKSLNINIYNDKTDFNDFDVSLVEDEDIIKDTKNKINELLSIFSDNVINSFHENNNNGLSIYLVSSITAKDKTKNVESPVAFTYYANNEFIIVINALVTNFDETLYHEFMHALEDEILLSSKDYFKSWSTYNPEGFKYFESYIKLGDIKYTKSEEDSGNVYFLNEYSLTYDYEDRAVIFSNAITNNDEVKEYDNISKKSDYLISLLNDYFKETIIKENE